MTGFDPDAGYFLPDDLGPGQWKRLRPGGPLEWVPDSAPRVHVAERTLQILRGISKQLPTRFVGHLCEDCGCAMTGGDVMCPGCLAWAVGAAERHARESRIGYRHPWQQTLAPASP